MLNDLTIDVYKAFYEALSDSIVIGGVKIPVFSVSSGDTTLPEWIAISQFEQLPESNKLSFSSRCSLLISVFVASEDMLRAATISNEVVNTLYTSKIAVVEVTGHAMVILNEPNISERTVLENDRIYSVKDIRVEMLIHH